MNSCFLRFENIFLVEVPFPNLLNPPNTVNYPQDVTLFGPKSPTVDQPGKSSPNRLSVNSEETTSEKSGSSYVARRKSATVKAESGKNFFVRTLNSK